MASTSTVQHRFANKDYNFEKGLKGSSVHIDGKNYYSYSTVFGQWVDDKVCIVYQGDTSVTSHKHQLGRYCFPKDVVLLPYDDGGSYYYGWHGCDLLGYSNNFTYEHRVKLIDYYVQEMYDALAAINGGKKKGLDTHAANVVEEYWGYIMKLCAMYRDTTINKWLRIKDRKTTEWKQKKTMVRLRDEGENKIRHYVDAMFGEGTWQAYYDYCARYRKAADKRAKVEALCKRLGIASPYEKYCGSSVLGHDMSADQIRNLTAKERNELHFASIMREENRKAEGAVKAKYEKNRENAYRWIVGYSPKKKEYCWQSFDDSVYNNCVNKDNGVVYECSGQRIYGFYWCEKDVSFDYDSFRKSEDKEQWIANFYAKCKEVALNRKAILTLQRIKAHTKEKVHSYDSDVFINDEYLRENTTEAEYAICVEFIRKQDKYYADKEARERAARIEMERRREEERKEKELQERIKREQINECLERGVEGCRDIWRKHYTGIADAKQYADDIDRAIPFYFGGNVLMRFSMNKDKIETSKSIRMTIATAKAMWKLVRKWHENPASFKQMQIKTLSGTYTIVSYKNDILTAGCHDIAYAEMKRMYNEIVKLENEAE